MSAEPTRPDDRGAVATYVGRRAGTAPGSGRPAPLDELVGPDGEARPALRDLAASIDVLGGAGLLTRRAQARRLVEDDGVTYGARSDLVPGDPAPDDLAGAGRARVEPVPAPVRRWALDPLPLVLDAGEWAALETSLAQRAMLLDAVLADLYGPRALLHQGVVPAEVVLGHPGFLRPVDQVRLPSSRQLFLTATDLGRGPDGHWLVLADRTQAPSGAGYAMENRRVVSRVLPGLYRDTPMERLREFFHVVRAALQEAAPQTAEPPRVVLLTPGAGTETAFDQAFLATLLGYPLVEGQDLTVREGRVWMRSVGRLEPVDVVLRRVDAWFCDPLELRPDSRLGVPGLLEASRLGTVSVVNPLGSGVLENPGLLPYLAAAGRMLLGAEPSLGSAPTYWCGEQTSRRHVLASLDRLVLKPIGRGVGRASLFGWELSAAERDDLRRRIEARPGSWCGQEQVETSTAPVVTSRGLEARHLVLRAFAVAQGGGYRLMSGGLARVAGRPASRFVSSSDGALAKDVWVLNPDAASGAAGRLDGVADSLTLVAPATVEPALAPRVAEDLFWLGRYAERAEDTARLLRVVDDLAEDHGRSPVTPGGQALAVLLAATGTVTGNGAATSAPHAELVRLAVDTARPGTLGFAVRRTIAVAQAVREQLSLDTWMVLGSLERVLAELADRADAAAPGDEPALQPTLARVLEALLALGGLGAESMVRDTGWYFMDLGRRLERALNLLAVLRATLVHPRGAAIDAVLLESVLVSAESVITFRRRHPVAPVTRGDAAGRGTGSPAAGGGSAAQLAGVLDLLLLDRGNPRALAYQLDRAETDLTRISPLDDPGRDVALDRALRAVSARLREADPIALARVGDAGRRGSLATLLDTLAAELADLAVAVEGAHFVHAAPLRPMPVAAPGWQA